MDASEHATAGPFAQAYGHGERIFDLAFHPSRSNIIASASEDLTARIWRREPDAGVFTQARSPPA
jgi:WD40 repeat protein